MGRRSAGLIAGLLALALSGCDYTLVVSDVSLSPVPASMQLHFTNVTSNVVLVGGSVLGDGPAPDRLLRPCGGTLMVPSWRLMTDDGRLLVTLLMDGTGRLDRDLADWHGDPADMPGGYALDVSWSTGEILPGELPKWVTIRPDGVDVSDGAPALAAPSSCAPWHEL